MSRKLTRVRIAGMLQFLATGARTKTQVAKRVGISRTSANEWVNVLHEAGLVHITGYMFTRATGYRAAVYRWGKDVDTPKPAAQTGAERVAKCRDKVTLDRAWKIPVDNASS